MKFGDLIPIAALIGGAYLVMKHLMPSTTATTIASTDVGDSAPSSYYWQPSQPYYPPEVYNTTIPVVPSEPGVSEGIPIPSNPAIPICPSTVSYPRYAGDDQKCCQCPQGHLHCGSAWNMDTQVRQGTILALCEL